MISELTAICSAEPDDVTACAPAALSCARSSTHTTSDGIRAHVLSHSASKPPREADALMKMVRNASCPALKRGERFAGEKELRADHEDHDDNEDGPASAQESIGDCRRCQASI